MQLDCIQITNFKGLREVEFRPSSFSCLVGENNSGKSSVLQAIVYALNRSGQLPLALHYDPAAPVEFRLRFSGVTEHHIARLAAEHRQRISDLVVDDCLQLIVRYRPEQKCETATMRRMPREPRYREDAISAALSGARGAAVAAAVQELTPEFSDGLPNGANITGAKEYLANRIAALPADQFDLVEGALPTGIASSIANLIPEPIYIPAVKNLGDDLKTAQSTTFGQLLGLLLDELQPDLHQIEHALTTLNSLLNRTEKDGDVIDGRHARVQAMEQRIEGFLNENFPSVRVELNIPPPELKAILNSAQIFVNDGSRDLIENKGDGIKRSLTFAVLQAYVHHRSQIQEPAAQGSDAPAPRPLLFLFEEPELYLHPRSQRVLFDTLAKISAEHQMVVTTHSPLFFAPGVTASFVRIAKVDAAPKPEGHLFPINFSLEPDNAEVFRLTKFEHSDAAFFSRRVVLFEGESDDAFCRHAARVLNNDWCFDRRCIAMVRVSGKGNFRKFRRFFEAFGIEVKIVADLDVIFDGYQHLCAPIPIAEIRAQVLQMIDGRVQALGLKPEPTSRKIRDKIHTNSWRDRYGRAKDALDELQRTGQLRADTIDMFAGLFTWEQEDARLKACLEDDDSRNAMVPLLDALRAVGICVLSRGAIEDYYPAGAENGQKPERAIRAIELLKTPDDIVGISVPLGPRRSCELTETFSELFK